MYPQLFILILCWISTFCCIWQVIKVWFVYI